MRKIGIKTGIEVRELEGRVSHGSRIDGVGNSVGFARGCVDGRWQVSRKEERKRKKDDGAEEYLISIR